MTSAETPPDTVMTADERPRRPKASSSAPHAPAQEGAPPSSKPGRHRRFRRDAVDARPRSRLGARRGFGMHMQSTKRQGSSG